MRENPGELERKVHRLRREVHGLLAAYNGTTVAEMAEVRRDFIARIPDFEARYTSSRGTSGGAPRPLAMMDGSSHRQWR